MHSSLDEHKKNTFRCFTPDSGEDPCSSRACTGNVADVVQAAANDKEKEDVEIWLKLSNDLDTRDIASIWEINFSSSNESNKLEGIVNAVKL